MGVPISPELAGTALKAASGVASGLFKTIGSFVGGRKRRREQRRAKKEFGMYKEQYKALDTSNLALGQENVYEDLTVNQRQSQFLAEQQNQGLANTLSANQQAAGGSGIAVLAQAMANQQNQNLASAAVSIGEQERQNQLMAMGEAGRIQQAEIQGAYDSRALEYDKTETLLGMSGQRLAAANQARQEATQATFSGLGDIAGGALTGAQSGMLGEKVQNAVDPRGLFKNIN